jgi:hypothetical protein
VRRELGIELFHIPHELIYVTEGRSKSIVICVIAGSAEVGAADAQAFILAGKHFSKLPMFYSLSLFIRLYFPDSL